MQTERLLGEGASASLRIPVFYAYDDLCAWLGQMHQMIAAVSFGYPDNSRACANP